MLGGNSYRHLQPAQATQQRGYDDTGKGTHANWPHQSPVEGPVQSGSNKTGGIVFNKKKGDDKKKKEAKKKNVAAIWKTEGVSHIPARQANNKLINPYL